jgi:hypothetical protein
MLINLLSYSFEPLIDSATMHEKVEQRETT